MNQIVKSAADALTIGETFFKSGMFSDIKSAQQAVVKIMAGAEMGISPFAAMSGIHIIQGKPTIGAGLMAARVKGFGKYDYRVLEHTDKVCSIEWNKGSWIGYQIPGNFHIHHRGCQKSRNQKHRSFSQKHVIRPGHVKRR